MVFKIKNQSAFLCLCLFIKRHVFLIKNAVVHGEGDYRIAFSEVGKQRTCHVKKFTEKMREMAEIILEVEQFSIMVLDILFRAISL